MKVEITITDGEKSTIQLNSNELETVVDALRSGSIALFTKSDAARRASKVVEADRLLERAMFVSSLGRALRFNGTAGVVADDTRLEV
jgi:hypothetical protein|tara:strand:- start:434 stop:694 length:261 start_codon:yes stop_codon:yes gene_type:complete